MRRPVWSFRPRFPWNIRRRRRSSQLGLPGPLGLGEAPEVGALSARAEQELAPSIIEHVETTDDVKALIDNLAAQNTALIRGRPPRRADDGAARSRRTAARRRAGRSA